MFLFTGVSKAIEDDRTLICISNQLGTFALLANKESKGGGTDSSTSAAHQSVPALMPGLANLCSSMRGITIDVRELLSQVERQHQKFPQCHLCPQQEQH